MLERSINNRPRGGEILYRLKINNMEKNKEALSEVLLMGRLILGGLGALYFVTQWSIPHQGIEMIEQAEKGCGKWTYFKDKKNLCSYELPKVYSSRPITLTLCSACKQKTKALKDAKEEMLKEIEKQDECFEQFKNDLENFLKDWEVPEKFKEKLYESVIKPFFEVCRGKLKQQVIG